MPKYQSAYSQFHSTEMAVTHRPSGGGGSALCLPDLAVAFDTIDHSLLLTRLQRCFGVEGCRPKCFTSVSGRSYCVVVDGVSLKGHLQGSVLGLVLFIMYMADLVDNSAADYTLLQAYADDNQLYVYCQPEDAQSTVFSEQQCVSVVEQWMVASRLELNMNKTELMWTGTKYADVF